jgi:hypothetical protein
MSASPFIPLTMSHEDTRRTSGQPRLGRDDLGIVGRPMSAAFHL